MFLKNKKNPKDVVKRKGAGFLGMSPLGLGMFVAGATTLAVFATSYFSEKANDNLQKMLVAEGVEVYKSAKEYSRYATAYGSGWDGVNADTVAPWKTLDFKLVVSTGGDASYFCSATSAGCKVKYYIGKDNGGDTFHFFADAKEALENTNDATDLDAIKKYEISLTRAISRETKGRSKIDGASTAMTASDTDPDTAVNNNDAQLEFWNLQ